MRFLKKCDIYSFPDRVTVERGIPEKKKSEILKLLRVVPTHKRVFWENMKINDNSTDLMSNNDLMI